MTETLERLWSQQFPTSEFNADDPRLIVVRDFTEFFQNQGRSLFKLVRRGRVPGRSRR